MPVIDQDLHHAINSLRLLSVDMIRVAGSGHPGIALGAAPIIYTLYQNHLKITALRSYLYKIPAFSF